jgi:hypothetical protein
MGRRLNELELVLLGSLDALGSADHQKPCVWLDRSTWQSRWSAMQRAA